MTTPIPVGILGATGCVGQRFIQLLEAHPQFHVAAVGASPKSAGHRYDQICQWKMATRIPETVASMIVQPCDPAAFKSCKVIFSGLDSNVAGDIEDAFRRAEFPVFSNAKNYRMVPNVPLVVPMVNASHLTAIEAQKLAQGLNSGFIVTNANCSTTGLVVALKPLHDAFCLDQVHVTTMQAISGAGYPGIPSMDILANVVPFIDGEEDKIETEPAKILGGFDSQQFIPDVSFSVSAQCNRVPVFDGHTECVAIRFKNPPASLDDVARVLRNYVAEAQQLKVHSAPKQAIYVCDQANEKDRPQPRLDLMNGGGYAVTVGRLRSSKLWHAQFVILSHNTILGAAGSSIMNAEIALLHGLIK